MTTVICARCSQPMYFVQKIARIISDGARHAQSVNVFRCGVCDAAGVKDCEAHVTLREP